MTETETGRSDIFGGRGRQATIALGVMIALKILLLFLFAWKSRLVVDEFGQLGYAKYLWNGLFDTIEPPKAVGFALFYKLAHLIGWDATSILLVGRFQTALLGCATITMVYACARALGENRVRALTIVLILLSFSNVLEQIFRTRAEQLAVFFAVAALLVILRMRAHRPGVVLVAGLLSGLAFLATQKSVYFNVALGVALVADAAISRRYKAAILRGAWLVLGWAITLIAYCFIFGGIDPVPVARSLVFGPVEVATRGGAEYGGLRHFVLQTLARNSILYVFCFAGMLLASARIARLNESKRIALIFSLIITALVFAHDQPWPYVFVMALPFVSLWSLALFDRVAANPGHLRVAWVALGVGIAVSYVSNVRYLSIDNAAQLELVTRGEALIEPHEKYFDGIGMLPNRPEPSTLWLDKFYILRTLRDGKKSEAYRIFTKSPPKLILWSYRMDGIFPVIAPAIRGGYVRVAPNVMMAGRLLYSGNQEIFDVPIAGRYALYSETGEPLQGQIEIDGQVRTPPFHLAAGITSVILRAGPARGLLLPEGSYKGILKPGGENDPLFAGT